LLLVGCGGQSAAEWDEETGTIESEVKPAAQYDAEVPVAWYRRILELTRTSPGYSPPVASRAFGYVGVALYEALRPGIQHARSLVGQLNGLQSLPEPSPGNYHWPAVANAVLAQMARALYPVAPAEQLAAIDDLERDWEERLAAQANDKALERSRDWAIRVADAIVAWSSLDGATECYANNFPDGFEIPAGFGYWEPTTNLDGTRAKGALQPYWGKNRPFVLPVGDPNAHCDPGLPTAYSEEEGSAFWDEMIEVHDAVVNASEEEQKVAFFWSDDPGHTATPPGHSLSILTQLIEREKSDLGFAARAYSMVGIAVADAFIACWETKYRYNLVRPVTCINKLIDEKWRPLLSTPPFPEYTSGHSVQSGAAFLVLTELFGSDYAFIDNTHANHPGKATRPEAYAPRSYASFDAAAREAAMSRLYGGIHYRPAVDNGLAQGRCVGSAVLGLDYGLERKKPKKARVAKK
jgi:hypothetical protein